MSQYFKFEGHKAGCVDLWCGGCEEEAPKECNNLNCNGECGTKHVTALDEYRCKCGGLKKFKTDRQCFDCTLKAHKPTSRAQRYNNWIKS